jgi:hypothetical protein
MPTKGPGAEAVFATYICPYGPSKPCQNTNMRVIFSWGLKNGVLTDVEKIIHIHFNLFNYPVSQGFMRLHHISCSSRGLLFRVLFFKP